MTKKITRKELERVYRTMTVDAACEYLGVTQHTFYKTLDDAGIKRQRSAYRPRVALEVVD